MSGGQRTLLERHECVSPFVHRRIHPQRVRDNRRHALAPPHAPEAVRYTKLMRWFICRQALPCTSHRLRKVFLSTQESLVASTSGQESRRRLGEGIRSDFPILHQTVHGDKQLIYFDNGATSQKPKQVLEALRAYNEGYNANVHRGVHYLAAKVRKALSWSHNRGHRCYNHYGTWACFIKSHHRRECDESFSVQATSAYEEARAKVARLINARSSREIVFTPNATAGLNLVAQSWGRNNLGPGDEVLMADVSIALLCLHQGFCLTSCMKQVAKWDRVLSRSHAVRCFSLWPCRSSFQ